MEKKIVKINFMKRMSEFARAALLLALFALCIIAFMKFRAQGQSISGNVFGGGSPISGATVTLYAAGDGAPSQIAQSTTDNTGAFSLNSDNSGGAVLYIVAKGGKITGAVNQTPENSLTLLSILGSQPPSSVIINELTTVASAFTAARFINGESISGNALGLQIAAGNTPNLVDPSTGKWGKVLLDPLNITQNTTLANLNTLGNLIAAYGTVADDNWRSKFLQASAPIGGSTPTNTLEAISGIARSSYSQPGVLYSLFDEAYPQPADGSRRNAPYLPYLAYSPKDFALMLCFAGGGLFSPGKFVFDADGNLWSGCNWMPGSQSGVVRNIGGGTVKFAPNGTALSPPVTGFTGLGMDGVGWGTGVDLEKVWVTSFNGTISVMDFNGNPIGQESDFPMAGKMGQLMGVGVALDGDVWIADGTKNQMILFPGGRVKDGKIVNVDGLKSPFGIAIDRQKRVYVSNTQDITVVRFPADNPASVEVFKVGLSARGIGLDTKGNLWVASNFDRDYPLPLIPPGTTIMRQFQLGGENMMKNVSDDNPSGFVSMIRPDGTQPNPDGYKGGKIINVPWGLSIDGNDDVWVGNFFGRSAVLMAGEDTKGHAPGTNTGDVIHEFTSGSFQMITDVAIDPAGNLWAANNWDNTDAVLGDSPSGSISTKGGGSGLIIIYGVAEPVKTPLMGTVRKP